jgi:hypothetical protein
MNKWFTDYPLFVTEIKAPIREIKVLSYDGDKYCKVEYEGEIFEIKSGYIYPKRERHNNKKKCKNFIKLLKRVEI